VDLLTICVYLLTLEAYRGIYTKIYINYPQILLTASYNTDILSRKTEKQDQHHDFGLKKSAEIPTNTM
jgi:hypothetical protein